MKSPILRITALVTGLHFVLLVALATHTKTTVIAPLPKLAVQTITLSPPPPKAKPKPAPTKKKEEPKKTPSKPKDPPKKKDSPKPKDSSKEKEKQNSLLEEALASLNKISDEPTTTELTEPVTQLQIDGISSKQENFSTYCQELVKRLRLTLKLPEHGEVKIQLSLNRSGKVTKLTVLSSQSNVNTTYLETEIPKQHFPPFGTEFVGESEHKFILALSSE